MSDKIWTAIITAAGAVAVAGINCYASCHRDNAQLAEAEMKRKGVPPEMEASRTL